MKYRISDKRGVAIRSVVLPHGEPIEPQLMDGETAEPWTEDMPEFGSAPDPMEGVDAN